MTLWVFAGHLFTALILGSLIGLERQWRQRQAGLRTNALVAVSAAAFVSLSALVPGDNSPTRIASYVVSGIGFLGAGVILRDGMNVRGLNTAATLWSSAAVGVLAGWGFTAYAMVTTLMILLANVALRPLAHLIDRRPLSEATEVEMRYMLHLVCLEQDEPRVRIHLLEELEREKLHLLSLSSEDIENTSRARVEAEVRALTRDDTPIERIVSRLSVVPGVSAVGWTFAMDEKTE